VRCDLDCAIDAISTVVAQCAMKCYQSDVTLTVLSRSIALRLRYDCASLDTKLMDTKLIILILVIVVGVAIWYFF
jgi:hypothetical protein